MIDAGRLRRSRGPLRHADLSDMPPGVLGSPLQQHGGLEHRPECQLLDGEATGVIHPPVNASPHSRRSSCGHFMDINFKNPPPSFDMRNAHVRGSSTARVMVHSFTPATGFLHSNGPMLIRCVRCATGRSGPKFTHHLPQHNELRASITFPLGNTIAFT